jgi:DNA-binding transcriptional MerR regulator/methylmalonyl-CoA mutase cobalamin-binding subunit
VVVPDTVANDVPTETEGTLLTIQQAARILNLPAPTIRSWERRYGVPAADRSSGGHRRYTREQLDLLRQMRDLIAQGWRPVEAAPLVEAGFGSSPRALVDAFLQGARDLAPDRIARTLDVARQAQGLERTLDDVVLPAMRQVGEWWHSGRIDVAHEHLATNATRTWLSAIAPTGALRPQPPIILSCGPRDHHTLGLEAMAALLRHRRWDCRMLGARTPVESLGQAVQETNAVGVVLVSHLADARVAAVDALRSAGLRRAQLFYAGAAFASRRARAGVPGHYLGTNLAQAADLVADIITAASTGGRTEPPGVLARN